MTDQELLSGYVDVWWQAINDFTDLPEELDDGTGRRRPTSRLGRQGRRVAHRAPEPILAGTRGDGRRRPARPRRA